MQSAETVLDVIRERGRRSLPLERIYRQLFNPQLFLMAYGRIYRNSGAMTPGVTGETVDGMSRVKIDTIIGRCADQRAGLRSITSGNSPISSNRAEPSAPRG
nr:hypothetical protein [Streptomyces sp.]